MKHSPPLGGSVYAAEKNVMTGKDFCKNWQTCFLKIAEIVFGVGRETWYDTSVMEFKRGT